jgi:hypothetical protein
MTVVDCDQEAKALVRASKYSPLSQAQLALGNDTSEEPVARHACAHGENVNDDAKRAAIDPEALRLVVRCASWTNRLSRGDFCCSHENRL